MVILNTLIGICTHTTQYFKETDWLCFSSSLLLFQDVDIDNQSYTMTGLKKNTEYSFRVVANNKHGPGVSTEDIVVRTLSDGQLVWNFETETVETVFSFQFI